MAIDQSTDRTMFDGLRVHAGHEIECVCYGPESDPWNVAVECVTCGEVLFDADADSND